MRSKIPGKAGLWGAFWMLPTTMGDYPEMDVIEDPNLGNKGLYFVHATAPTDSNGGFVQMSGAIYKGYHQYGVEWNDQTVTFYFDHKAIAEYPTPPQFASLNMYLLLNLAVGGPGSWPGAAPAASIPADYKIDYIRAFSSNASDPAVAQQAVSSPDAADTMPSYLTPAAPDVATGTGPGALTLLMSEDYFDHDAKFVVAIDGVAQPGVFDVAAQNAKGQTQKFIFYGTYAPGVHTVTVTYINNLVGSAPYLSRKLYFAGMTLNGAPGTNLAPVPLQGGQHTMSFVAP